MPHGQPKAITAAFSERSWPADPDNESQQGWCGSLADRPWHVHPLHGLPSHSIKSPYFPASTFRQRLELVSAVGNPVLLGRFIPANGTGNGTVETRTVVDDIRELITDICRQIPYIFELDWRHSWRDARTNALPMRQLLLASSWMSLQQPEILSSSIIELFHLLPSTCSGHGCQDNAQFHHGTFLSYQCCCLMGAT